uniref:UDP-N-acetylmuramate--L-alanine ligase n=2 Tax=Micromonas pusilla TaxID=38833 RepID=A0A6U0JNU0_MICPS|mmetsp:Transcript_6144/g.22481  ORF Transcript_6144/g.22481 Transcript_6144/m.22481 type:complete len:578 (+) Transcript_6144:113-1846(+)
MMGCRATPIQRMYKQSRKPLPRCKHDTASNMPTNSNVALHFIGVGGSGMSALALVALSQGYLVSGSDLLRSAQLVQVEAKGAICFAGHSSTNVGSKKSSSSEPLYVPEDVHLTVSVPDAIVASSAVPRTNIEYSFAREAGIPVYNRAQWLTRTSKRKNVVAVAGTHGKTTTASMVAMVLLENDLDITALVGGNVRQFPGGENAIGGSGNFFLIEADEYDGAFLGLSPQIAVITNVEFDHPDLFKCLRDVRVAFKKFTRRIETGGSIVICGDDANSSTFMSKACSSKLEVVTYGFARNNLWRAMNVKSNTGGGTTFTVSRADVKKQDVSISLPGRHNVLNALAAIATASCIRDACDASCAAPSPSQRGCHRMKNLLCFDPVMFTALNNYRGIARRMQFVGFFGSCALYDDYAHHPTAIKAAIGAMREQYPEARVTVLFEPHTFSRTFVMLRSFVAALSEVDRVMVTSVYDARTELSALSSNAISGQDISRCIGSNSLYFDSFQDVVRQLLIESSILDSGKYCEGDIGNEIYEEEAENLPDVLTDNVHSVTLILGAGSSVEISAVLLRALRFAELGTKT